DWPVAGGEHPWEAFQAEVRRGMDGATDWLLADALVEADPRLVPLVRRLLGGTVVVSDLPTATQAAARLARNVGVAARFQFVTLDGHVVRSTGEIVGGRGDRQQRLVSFREQILREEAELAGARAALEALLPRRQQAEERRATLATAEAEARDALREAESTARALAQRRDELRQRAGGLERALAALARQREEVERQLAEEAERQRHATHRVEELAASLERVRATLDADDVPVDAARQEALSTAQTELAVAESELRASRGLLERTQADVQRAVQSEAAARRRAEEAAEQHQRLQAEAQPLAIARAAVEAERRPLEVRLRDLDAAARKGAEEMARLEEARRAAQHRVRQAEEERRRAALAAQRASAAVEQVRREAEAALEEDVTAAAPAEPSGAALVRGAVDGQGGEGGPLPDGTARHGAAPRGVAMAEAEEDEEDDVVEDPEAVRQRVGALRRQLREFGPVNLEAREEYRHVAERYRFLTAQADDLRQAAARLREGMAELRAEMVARFNESFAAVNAVFGETFTRLFGGGSARLVLTQPDSPLTTGVDLVAQPPGKRAQGLLALSGGERALTTIALFFALLRVNPSPFCLLDEVDAPLDDANVRRFLELLKSFGDRTQFIVITHNRATMEAADTLYGVTMGEQHTSRVVSLRLR
ncbi:MAG TPA: AAA family ATPase, partial [Chloroflexota bacterium]